MQKSMTESNLIPHLYLKDEFDLTDLVKFLNLLLNLLFFFFFLDSLERID
jgi:hypothetical protein